MNEKEGIWADLPELSIPLRGWFELQPKKYLRGNEPPKSDILCVT